MRLILAFLKEYGYFEFVLFGINLHFKFQHKINLNNNNSKSYGIVIDSDGLCLDWGIDGKYYQFPWNKLELCEVYFSNFVPVTILGSFLADVYQEYLNSAFNSSSQKLALYDKNKDLIVPGKYVETVEVYQRSFSFFGLLKPVHKRVFVFKLGDYRVHTIQFEVDYKDGTAHDAIQMLCDELDYEVVK